MDKVQIKVWRAGRRGNRLKAAYRSQLVNGEWERNWHHLTVADARDAQKTGKFEPVIGTVCEVVP